MNKRVIEEALKEIFIWTPAYIFLLMKFLIRYKL